MTNQAAFRESDERPDGATIEPARYRPPAAGVELPRPRIPWLSAFGIAALILAVWAAWFVVTARSVGLVASPANASITVNEWPAPRVGNHWLMRVGSRRVRVTAPGYTSFDGTIEVNEAQLQTHEVTLVPLPGHLRVAITPAVRGEIFLDQQSRGQVPALVADVPAGHRAIEIKSDRYLPYHAQLEIEGKGIEQALDVKLDPAWADVHVDSVPSEVEIRVDGRVVGKTPLTTELMAGRRTVELVSDGYKTWKQTLKITPGTPVELGEVVLAKADGRVRIASTPNAANVTLNGEFRGRTPIELAVLADKKHKIGVLKEGYRVHEQVQVVKSGRIESLAVELVPELAKVHLVTTPDDAQLLIDGAPSGSATQTLNLPTHSHEITIRRLGYATYQTRITPRKGVEKRFKIRLKSVEEMARDKATPAAPKARPSAKGSLKGFVKTFAGQDMKLFNGGRAKLGSPRGSTGHKANEVVREAILERPFYMALKEVTNAEYRLFLAGHNSGEFINHSLDKDAQSVANVSWEASVLYCNWLSRRDGLPPFYQIMFGEVLGVNPDAPGYRLPTEAEWEWAARIPPSGEPTTFPWGEKFPPQGRSGNYADASAAAIMGDTIGTYDDGYAVAAPVGSFPPNLKGLYDMDGNVAEWVHDYYEAAPASAPALDSLGPRNGTQHVIKGGSWAQGTIGALRMSHRDFGTGQRDDVGFRLARYAQ